MMCLCIIDKCDVEPYGTFLYEVLKLNERNNIVFSTFTLMNYTLQMGLHIVTLQNILLILLYHYNVLNLKVKLFCSHSFSTLQASARC